MSQPTRAPGSPLPLAGLSRWMSHPSTLAGLLGAVVAVFYGLATLELPPGTTAWFIGCVGFFALAATWRGDVQEQRTLITVRRLGEGSLRPTQEHLRRALREVAGYPDRAFWIHLQNWVGGCLLIAISYRLTAQVDWSVVRRIAYLGVALGPATAVFTQVLATSRSRAAIERIGGAGLSVPEVLRALPPEHLSLRARLVFFTSVCVLTPTLFILDIAALRTDRVLAKLDQPAVAAEAGEIGMVVGLGLLVVVLVIGLSYLLGTALGKPMRSISAEATRVASGDLRAPRVIPAEHEVWAVASAFTTMQSQLTDAISRLVLAGDKIGVATSELVQSSGKHESGAAQQASALAQTSATTEELARSAGQIAENAQSVAQLAEATLQAAQGGMKSAEAFFVSMGRMREGNQGIADSVVKLNKRVQQIGRIVEFINGIADKSDLLALNAELEGTKAGDVGRGFSLVAAEMRRLAETVIESTREIGRLIEEIRDATNAAVMATEAGVKATDAGSALSQKVSETLSTILGLAAQTFDAVRSISLATHQQQSGTDQLATAMNDVLRTTESGAAATRQMVAANADLSTLARDLKGVVERFTVS